MQSSSGSVPIGALWGRTFVDAPSHAAPAHFRNGSQAVSIDWQRRGPARSILGVLAESSGGVGAGGVGERRCRRNRRCVRQVPGLVCAHGEVTEAMFDFENP